MKQVKLFFLLSFVFSFSMQAQKIQPIPMDTSIHYGKLSNGLTYYIRHNKQPKDRAEFYIAQNVGAILEEDSQNGLAHFLEHMAFNGTRHYPDKNLINYLESIGVRFGTNINAYTSLDETVYNLSDVPTTRDGILDSALLVLHDWSSSILLENKEIDKERGVIREEWRQGQTALRRLWALSNKVTRAGSQYAKRDVIGDTAVINNFSYETLRRYYKKWYRPDLQAIIIVGDVNVALVESKIKALFADIPAPINPAQRIYYPIPDNKEPIVGIFTDPEMQSTQIRLDFKQEALPDDIRLSVEGYVLSLINRLISSMTDTRLDEIRQAPETPFAGTVSTISELTRTKDAYIFFCNPVMGKESLAINRLLKEAEIIKRFGFNNSELERAKTDLLSGYEKNYKERDQQKNNSLAREFARNFTSAEPVPGIEWEYKFISSVLPTLTLETINPIAKQYLKDTNIILTVTGPEKDGLIYPTKEDLLKEIASVKVAELTPYQEVLSKEPLIQKNLKPGKVKKSTVNKTMGTTEWILSNGIRIIFKATKFKEDEIKMYALSEGGSSLIPTETIASARYVTPVISQSGLGTFNQIELNKKLTGKIASASPGIGNYEEFVKGNSSVKDLETMLQLTNLYFSSPREDENAYNTLTKAARTYLENATLDPRNAYSDSISMILYGYNPRVLPNNIATLNKVNYPDMMRIYKERFGNPADFTFVFVGNIDEKTFKPLIETNLGSLKTTKIREKWFDNGLRIQKGTIYKEIDKPLKVNKITNYIRYRAVLPYTLNNDLLLTTIENLLDLRYTATIREEEGGSYGVGVSGYLSNRPIETGDLVIGFDTDPKIYKKMLGIIHSEIKSMAENGPKPEDLNKVKLNLLKKYKEDIAENNWWLQTISTYYRDGLNYYTDYEKMIESLRSEDIQVILKNFLEQNNVAEILLVPEKK